MSWEILNYSIINSLDFLSREGLMIHCIDSLKLNWSHMYGESLHKTYWNNLITIISVVKSLLSDTLY